MSQVLDTTKVINDDDRSFYALDFVKLLNTPLLENDEVLIPVSMRDQLVTFWETGGKDPLRSVTATCVIATEEDTIPDALVFGKLYRSPNRRQALISLKPGYKLYIGKVNVKNPLSPKVKILHLQFLKVEQLEHGPVGRFLVDKVSRSYQDIEGSIPAERLFDKMLTKDVLRPFFANGWTITNLSRLKDLKHIEENFIRLMGEVSETLHLTDPSEFVDVVEEELVRLDVPRLSSALQWLDFDAGIVGIKPLLNLELPKIDSTIENASVSKTFTIKISDLRSCFNPKLLFDNEDPTMLEKVLERDANSERLHTLGLGGRVYGILRGYKG